MLMFILLNLVEFLVTPKVNINLTTDVLKIQKITINVEQK